MQPFTIGEIITAIIGAIVVAMHKLWTEHRQTKRIKAKAQAMLADPSGPDNPVEAVENATIETMRPRIRKLSESISPPNGLGKSER